MIQQVADILGLSLPLSLQSVSSVKWAMLHSCCMLSCAILIRRLTGNPPLCLRRSFTGQTHYFKEQHLTEHVTTCPGGGGVGWVSVSLGVFMCLCFILGTPDCCSFPVQRQNKHIKAKMCSFPCLHPHHSTFLHKWLATDNYAIKTIFRIYLSGWSNSPFEWH